MSAASRTLRDAAEKRSSERTNPCPTSRAESAAWIHVTGAWSAIASSRLSMGPLQQREERLLQPRAGQSHHRLKHRKRAERQRAPLVEDEHPPSELLRVGELVDAEQEGGPGSRALAEDLQHVHELKRIKHAERLV